MKVTLLSRLSVPLQKELPVPLRPFLPFLFYGTPLYFTCLPLSDCLRFPFSTAQQTLPSHHEMIMR